MKSKVAFLAGLAAALGAVSVAQATTTYDYTGNAFDTVHDASLGTQISGQFTLDIASTFTGGVNASDLSNWSISSGAYTLDAAHNTLDDFSMALVNGVVESWKIAASVAPLTSSCCTVYLLTQNDSSQLIPQLDGPAEAYASGIPGLVSTTNDFNSIVNDPGTWTVASGAPEPSTWAMMLLGLLGLGAALRVAGRAKVIHA